MSKAKLGGTEVEVDEDGFIQEPDKWNKEVAADIAKEESSVNPMGSDHWKLVDYIREYYVKYGIAPAIRMLCKQNGFELKYVYQMFPKGPAAGACKVAGLPKPTGCV